jgi:hypothetical protein
MPGCNSCYQSSPSFTGNPNPTCSSGNICSSSSDNVKYIGANLSCTGINTNDSLTVALQKIDPLICAASGDYSTFNVYCLAPVTNQQEFVEKISEAYCSLQDDFDTFVGTTFPAYQSTISASLLSISSPNITCASASVNSSDSLSTLLSKYCTKFAAIDASLNPSSANWTSCYAVSPIPTTIVAGFNVLIAQVCLLKTAVESATGALPVFNNTGSCLASPGANDSLVDTVNKIRTRLCLGGTIDTTTLTWGCTTAPSGAQNLQDGVQNILTSVTNISKALPTEFSADFTVTNVDNGNLCLGKHIALATPSTQDRFVAATTSDTSPGTLQAKITAGTNVTLDYTTTPGQMIINASGGGGSDSGLVLADNTDVTADYLINKLEVSTPVAGITVTPNLDVTDTDNHKISLVVAVDLVALFSSLITAAGTDAGLKSAFCTLVSSCPSPCAAPLNVQVTYSTGSTTSTTTTSTTSTTTSTSTTTTTTL